MNLDWLNDSLADELTDSGLLLSIAAESLSIPLVGVYSIDVTYVDDSTEQFTGTGTLLIDGSIERHIKSISGSDSQGNIFLDVNRETGTNVPELIQNKDGVTNGTFEQLYEQQTYTIAGNNSDFIGLANFASDTAVRGVQGNLIGEFEGLDGNTSSRIFLNLLTCRLLSLVASQGLEYDAKSHAQAGVSISQVFCYSLRVYVRGIILGFVVGDDTDIERCFVRGIGRQQNANFTVNIKDSLGSVGMVGPEVTLNVHNFIQLNRAVIGNASTATTANFSNVVSVSSNFQLGQNVASYEAFGTRVNVDNSIIRQANIGNHQGANNLFGVDATSAFVDSENGNYTISQAFAEANLIGKGVNGSNIAEFAYLATDEVIETPVEASSVLSVVSNSNVLTTSSKASISEYSLSVVSDSDILNNGFRSSFSAPTVESVSGAIFAGRQIDNPTTALSIGSSSSVHLTGNKLSAASLTVGSRPIIGTVSLKAANNIIEANSITNITFAGELIEDHISILSVTSNSSLLINVTKSVTSAFNINGTSGISQLSSKSIFNNFDTVSSSRVTVRGNNTDMPVVRSFITITGVISSQMLTGSLNDNQTRGVL